MQDHEDVGPGAHLPEPIEGLDICEMMYEPLRKLGFILVPMLVGAFLEPLCRLGSTWKPHMIGYTVPQPQRPEEELSVKAKIFEDWFGDFDTDPREED